MEEKSEIQIVHIYKTPEYILRNTRKYAKENRDKINKTRKRTTFIRRIKSLLDNPKMDDFERHFKITMSKNYELFENDVEVKSLMSKLNIES